MERSAGILVYRIKDGEELEVLLGKCGGPKWEKPWIKSWNIPKGHVEKDENDLTAAFREFREETSLKLDIPTKDKIIDLGTARTSTGKEVRIFAIEKDYNEGISKVEIKSNVVQTEWPRGSGNFIDVPEMSEAKYFELETAKIKIFPYQKVFLTRLEERLKEENDFT